MTNYDIIIIGAGISGLVLATHLSDKYKILVIEKRDIEIDSFTSKSCGGMLNSDAQRALAKISISIPIEVLEAPQPFALKIIDLDNNISGLYQKSYINIKRDKFEQFLRSKVSSNVQFAFPATFTNFEEKNNECTVTYFYNDSIYEAKSKIVISAEGAFSKLRKILFPNSKIKTYTAIQEYYPTFKKLPYYYGFACQDVTDFYSWIIPKNNTLVLGATFAKDVNGKYHANEKMDILREKLKKHGFDFDKSKMLKKEGSILFRPNSIKDFCLQKGTAVFVGEAGGLISPSSAEGISYAINSAIILAEALNKNIDATQIDAPLIQNKIRNYEKKIKPMLRKLILKKVIGKIMFSPISRKIIMKTRVGTIESNMP